MNYFDKQISIYSSAKDNKGGTITLKDFLFSTDNIEPLITMIHTNPSNKSVYKKQLPCATISGLFNHRGKDGLTQHSGLICLDFDQEDNPLITDWEEFKYSLSKCKNILYAGLSCSGNGVFAIIPISHPEEHEAQFDALVKLFNQYNIIIDKSGRDVCRLRFQSVDNNPIINENPEPFRGVLKHDEPKVVSYSNTLSNDRVSALITKIEQLKIDITAEYSDWVKIGYSLATTKGEAGRKLFHRISRFNPNYKSQQCDKQFNSCLKSSRGDITDKTLFDIAKRYNVMLNIK